MNSSFLCTLCTFIFVFFCFIRNGCLCSDRCWAPFAPHNQLRIIGWYEMVRCFIINNNLWVAMLISPATVRTHKHIYTMYDCDHIVRWPHTSSAGGRQQPKSAIRLGRMGVLFFCVLHLRPVDMIARIPSARTRRAHPRTARTRVLLHIERNMQYDSDKDPNTDIWMLQQQQPEKKNENNV